MARLEGKRMRRWIVALGWGGWAAAAAAAQAPAALDAVERREVIAAVRRVIESEYVLAQRAAAVAGALRDKERQGRYAEITVSEALAEALTADLQAASGDRHLQVRFSPEPLPANLGEPEPASPVERKRQRRAYAEINDGFLKAERLSGNLGLLDIDRLVDPAYAGDTAAAALAFLANTDALILDLRYCSGGHGGMVAMLASYLMGEEPVHLNDYRSRGDRDVKQSWTWPWLPGARYEGKPVYVLTSGRTFSAAEELAYDLQSLKRASIVGERTRGGAHPVQRFRLNDHFGMQVPVSRAVNPITGTNWEGTGVAPDLEVPGDQALAAAQRAALERLLAAQPEHPLAEERRRALAKLTDDAAQGAKQPKAAGLANN